MHTERYFVDEANYQRIYESDYRIAVGTTSLRALEAGISPEQLRETNIFLHPGVDVRSIDALVTNFHLPESSLMMLISSLIGRKKALELYQVAIEHQYRFFSYGDGMCILRDPKTYKDLN